MVPPCDLGFLTAWYLKIIWHFTWWLSVPRKNVLEACITFFDLASEVTKYHFYWTLLVKAVTSLARFKERMGDVDPHLSMDISKNLQPWSTITTVVRSLMISIELPKICIVPREPRPCWPMMELETGDLGLWTVILRCPTNFILYPWDILDLQEILQIKHSHYCGWVAFAFSTIRVRGPFSWQLLLPCFLAPSQAVL